MALQRGQGFSWLVLWSLRSGDLIPFVLSLSLSLFLFLSLFLSLGLYLPLSLGTSTTTLGPLPTPAQVVAHLFASHAPQAAPQRLGKSSSVTRLYKAHTVAAKFQQSLLDLVEKMER